MTKLLLLLTISTFCVGVTEHEDGAGNNCDIKDQDFKTHKPTEAIVGNNVTLPCVPSTFSINIEDDIISWTKGVKDICIIKNKRVNYIKEGLKSRIPDNISEMEKNGHASISLINLRKTDGGDYCCCIELLKHDSRDMKCINHTLVVRDKDTGNDDLY
ncbi:hypothetical protein AMECASPLE_031232, partial [Ameca splendens]